MGLPLLHPELTEYKRGRPASSHYFIGAQGNTLFYLDPHHTRPALPHHPDPLSCTEEEVDSCHTRRLRRLNLSEMDPSMLIGFLIRSEDEWVQWRRSIKHVQGKTVISVTDRAVSSIAPSPGGLVDEVEALSDDDEEDDGVEVDGVEDDGVVVPSGGV
ncbi:cysteine protease ATG4 [Candidatus Bathyarchaeota archaeon]|nr:cysteine protease ATG4 [Candidatus Bathyarchaeota archaeon]